MPVLSRRSGRDERDTLYPAELRPLIDDRFVTSCDLFEEYVSRQALAILRATGLAAACATPARVNEAVSRAGLDPGIALVPSTWLLEMAAERGWVSRTGDAGDEAVYVVDRPLPSLSPDDVRDAQLRHDPACLPAYEIAQLATTHYPAVLRGSISGEQALFGPEGILPWMKYFSNDNPIYALSNRIGAIAAASALPPGEADILEIGTGLGSGADALLELLEARQVASRYLATDVSPLFLKRARRLLATRHPQACVETAALDIDRPFAAQGLAAASRSLVFGVNVLHVARDLAATLAELKRVLRPEGTLVMAECVRPFAGHPFHFELPFNLLATFRDAVRVPGWRPNGGFLAPEQWRSALACNGFVDVRIYPDIETIRDAYPAFVSAAVVARSSD